MVPAAQNRTPLAERGATPSCTTRSAKSCFYRVDLAILVPGCRAGSGESPSECLRPVVYSSPIGCTSCMVEVFKVSEPSRSFIRALSGRLKFTVRRHKFNKDYLARAGTLNKFSGSGPDALHLGRAGGSRSIRIGRILALTGAQGYLAHKKHPPH